MHPSASHLIALLSTLLLGCAASGQSTPPSDAVDGLGAESIDTTAFSSVAAQCTCYVDIKVGKAHGIVVRSRDEALSDVKVEVEDDTLKLQFLPSSIEHARAPVHFQVTVPELRAVDAKIVTQMTVEGMSGQDLSVSADGASQVEVAGDVQTLHAELHNRARLDARALRATDVEITIDGRGEAEVSARELLRASVYRFGKVWYHGEPKALDVEHGRRRVRPG